MNRKYLRGLNKASIANAKECKPPKIYSVIKGRGCYYLVLREYIGTSNAYHWDVLCSNGYMFVWWIGHFRNITPGTMRDFTSDYQAQHLLLRKKVFEAADDVRKILPD